MSDRDEAQYVLIERESGGSLGAFMWGAALGAGLALLLAPGSGEQTRTGIRSGVQRLRDRAEDAVRTAQDGVTGRIDGVRSEVRGRVDAAREAFEAGRRAARETRQEYEYRSRTPRSTPTSAPLAAEDEETGA
jgi:gas vesicle protein